MLAGGVLARARSEESLYVGQFCCNADDIVRAREESVQHFRIEVFFAAFFEDVKTTTAMMIGSSSTSMIVARFVLSLGRSSDLDELAVLTVYLWEEIPCQPEES